MQKCFIFFIILLISSNHYYIISPGNSSSDFQRTEISPSEFPPSNIPENATSISHELIWKEGEEYPILQNNKIPPPLRKRIDMGGSPASASNDNWYAGAVWPSNYDTKSAKWVYMSLTIPPTNPRSSDFYYVLISAWDSNSSYVQLGIAADYGSWGLTYSWTKVVDGVLEYFYEPSWSTLVPGVTYDFAIGVWSGNTYFWYKISNGDWMYILTAPTGGNYLVLSNVYESLYGTGTSMGYTDYEEIWYPQFGIPEFDFYMFKNYWADFSDSSYWTIWDEWRSSAPESVTVILQGNDGRPQDSDVFIRNQETAYNIYIDSIEDTGDSSNKGMINSYSLPTNIIKDAGSYSVTYYPESGYSFVRWETSGSVSISNTYSQSTTVTINGDGTLRVIYHNDNQPPTAHINSITPNPATQGQSVSFSGHGSDTDGTIVAYNWRSSKDGQLSTSASFSKSSLSVGTHTIYFKVQDDDGAWSSEVTKALTVNPETNNPPSLSNGYVTPTSGDTSTTFSYYVTYSDPEGVVPSTRRVYIDDTYYVMSLYSGSSSSGTYRYQTKLSAGSHNYYFQFSDGTNTVRLPSSGSYSGPTVGISGERPLAPVLKSPSNDATGVSLTPTLSWNSVSATPSVDYYQLAVWDDSSNTLLYMVHVTSTSDVVSNLQAGRTYRWAVWAHNSAGYSDASTIWRFTTQAPAPPTAPILDSPADGAYSIGLTPTLSWHSISATPSVDYYQLAVWDDSSNVLVYMVHVSGTSDIAQNLEAGRTYRWAVWAHNSVGYGNPSAVWRFTIEVGGSHPNVPVLLSPADSANGVSLILTLSWSSVSANPAVDYYQLAVWDDSTDTLVYMVHVSANSDVVHNLQSAHTYRWAVWAHNSAGYSDASTIWRFTTGTDGTTPPAPTLISPANTASGISLTPTLSWSSVSSTPPVDYYQLAVWDDSSNELVYMVHVTETSDIVYHLQNEHTYRWAVWAHNTNGYSDASSIWRFTTGASALSHAKP